jgi:hypothetical protein
MPTVAGCAATTPTTPDSPLAGGITQDQCALNPSSALCQVLTPPTQSDPNKPLNSATTSAIDLTLRNAPGKQADLPGVSNLDTPAQTNSSSNQTASSGQQDGGGNSVASKDSGVRDVPVKKMYCN